MKLILITGKAQHGKDATAKALKQIIEADGKKVLIAHYADLLKYICKTFFGWNGEKDEAGRTLLQRVGTDVIRKKDPDYWVRFIKSILSLFPEEWDYVIIPDTRFPNEIMFFDSVEPTTVKVIRPNFKSSLTAEQQAHPSETALDNYDFLIDHYIVAKSLSELQCKAVELYEKIKH